MVRSYPRTTPEVSYDKVPKSKFDSVNKMIKDIMEKFQQ